jgi:hypothetical protein
MTRRHNTEPKPMIESLEDRAFFSVAPMTEVGCTNNLRTGDTQALYAPSKPSGVIPSTQTNLVVIAIIAVLIG